MRTTILIFPYQSSIWGQAFTYMTMGEILFQTTTPVHAILGLNIASLEGSGPTSSLQASPKPLRAEKARARSLQDGQILGSLPPGRVKPRLQAPPYPPGLALPTLLLRHLPSRLARRGPEAAPGTSSDWLQLAAGAPFQRRLTTAVWGAEQSEAG